MNKDITLPYELATKDLSLQEIGTIFTMFATQRMSPEEVTKWAKDDEYLESVEYLLEREYVKIRYDEYDNAIMDIDLTDKEPEPFWEIYDYDLENNPIYQHPSHFGDDEYGTYFFKIYPKLVDLKIIWGDMSDSELLDSNQYFESLEEAEEFYKKLLKDQLEYIYEQGR
jgi:hypothetical protein